ncbi:MAG: mechanosensitive ion channel family protein [Methylophilaceae bacterium]
MNSWLHSDTFLGLPIEQWIYAALVAAIAYLLIFALLGFIVRKLSDISQRTSTRLDDILLEVMRETNRFTIALFAVLMGIHFLDLPDKWVTRLDHVSFVIIGVQIALWLNKGITIWSSGKLVHVDGTAENPVITAMLSWIFKTIVWTVVLLTMLANVGVNITAFVASLGVGGVAVALAVQNILSDLFASLAIGLDKPFVIGDFIVFGDVAGSIERVGLKTTHIRSISGEQIVCSNTELLKNTIHNYKRMAERRVVFKFGLTYATEAESIEKIPQIVRAAIEQSEHTRFDRAHFKEFGASSLDFEVVYFVDSSDFNLYMDIQQAINLYLIKAFKAIDAEFAYPTMTLDMPVNEVALRKVSSKKVVKVN